MTNLLVTGSIALDRIAVFQDRFANHILPDMVHRLNVSFTVEKMTVNHGGTGANIAYSLALMGDKPVLLGAVGNDAGDYLKSLKRIGVNVDYVKEYKSILTAHATIMTDMDDNQITAFYMGAMSKTSKSKISNLKSQIDLAIISPNDIQAMSDYADYCFKNEIPFIADPGQAIPAFSKKGLIDLITGSSILICNDYEWELIQKKTGMNKKQVLEKVAYLIITYGENGSKIWHGGSASVIDIPVVKAKKVVDPTGCGDAYRAGLMYGVSKGLEIEQSAKIGAWMGAKAVGVAGTQNHKIEKINFNKFLKTI